MDHSTQVIIAISVFLLTYAIIIAEKIHRMVVAMFGGLLMLYFGIFNQEQAVRAIDFNTIGLLVAYW